MLLLYQVLRMILLCSRSKEVLDLLLAPAILIINVIWVLNISVENN